MLLGGMPPGRARPGIAGFQPISLASLAAHCAIGLLVCYSPADTRLEEQCVGNHARMYEGVEIENGGAPPCERSCW